jgi:glycosyltransferase involved in cell wall biosynthesis
METDREARREAKRQAKLAARAKREASRAKNALRDERPHVRAAAAAAAAAAGDQALPATAVAESNATNADTDGIGLCQDSAQARRAPQAVLIEPYYGGSHKQFIDLLVSEVVGPCGAEVLTVTLPAKKWHWSMRTAGLCVSRRIPNQLPPGATILASSYLNLCELLALRPDLRAARTVLYFHENQLTYPTQLADKERERDFQFGWIQIMSCMVADVIAFNSGFNMNSFLGAIDGFMRRVPDPAQRVLGLSKQLRAKCRVVYFPLQLCPAAASRHVHAQPVAPTAAHSSLGVPALAPVQEGRRLQILWNHRWEYDKCPEEFLIALAKLEALGCDFGLVMLGAASALPLPPYFELHKRRLSANGRLDWWGYADDRQHYFELLRNADVAVSTAMHEFFGVAMLEAAFCGCYPLVPDALVYPEIFPSQQHRYQYRHGSYRTHICDKAPSNYGAECASDDEHCSFDVDPLVQRLRELCGNPAMVRSWRQDSVARESLALDRFALESLRPIYAELLGLSPGEPVSAPSVEKPHEDRDGKFGPQ